MFIRVNGNRINVEVLGPGEAPVVIAHHGGGGIGSLEEPRQTFAFLTSRYRLVVFDARGCGRSQGNGPLSHAQWVADVDAIREWVGAEQIVIAGGSYGGFIAMEYAIAYPERVRAMVLRDTSPDSSNLAMGRENARRQTRVAINWENYDRYWTGQVTDNDDLKRCWSELAPLYDKRYDPAAVRRRVARGYYRYETHNWCMRHRGEYDVKPGLPSVKCPTLVMVGRHDWTTPVQCSQTIASLLPNARLVIFENSGHSPQVEEQSAFESTVWEFLEEVDPVTY